MNATAFPDSRAPARARIVAVTSGKGGVGKTFFSANAAAALARRGLRVLVLDADLGLANLDVVLNLHPKITLHDVFTDQATLVVNSRLFSSALTIDSAVGSRQVRLRPSPLAR